MMRFMGDNVFALRGAISKERFEQSHIVCMTCIKPQVNALVTATQALLEAETLSANDGCIDEEEKQMLTDHVNACKRAVREFAVAFDGTRRRVSPDRVVSPDLQSESSFVYALSVYSRQAVDYTQDMIKVKKCNRQFPEIAPS